MEFPFLKPQEPRVFVVERRPEPGRVFVQDMTAWFERHKDSSGHVTFTLVADGDVAFQRWLEEQEEPALSEAEWSLAGEVLDEFASQGWFDPQVPEITDPEELRAEAGGPVASPADGPQLSDGAGTVLYEAARRLEFDTSQMPRLVEESGVYGLAIGPVAENDRVLTHEGMAVLAISRPAASTLNGVVLEVKEADGYYQLMAHRAA